MDSGDGSGDEASASGAPPEPGGEPMAVIVATRDRPEMLEGALAALMAVVRPQDEVVVVDSASRSPATQEVARRAGARVVRCERPGASLARNTGVQATTAPLIAVVDDDARPHAGWTAALSRSFDDPTVGFATGRVVGDTEDPDSPVIFDHHEPRRFVRGDDPMHFGHGTNSAFRRTAFEAAGGYDEALGPGAPLGVVEEQDLFWRLLHDGWVGAYTPDAVVEHLAWRDRGTQLRTQWHYGRGSGALAAKAWRLDRRDGRRMVGRRLWGDGLRLAWSLLRRGWKLPALTELVKVVAVLLGAGRSLTWAVRDGHYRARRRGSGPPSTPA